MSDNVLPMPMAHRAPRCDCGWTAPYTMQVEIEGHLTITAMGPDKVCLVVRIQCPMCGHGRFRMEKSLE